MPFTTFREYITQNAEAIRNYLEPPYVWSENLSEGSILAINQANENHDFRNVEVPELMDRREVSREWRDGSYRGFVTTLFWGGYHKSVFTRSHLPAVAAIPREEIEAKLSRVKDYLLDNGNFKAAFESMLPGGKYHIPGIGIDFFTRFMYFMARDIGYASGIQPLTFDTQSRMIHICLLKDSGENVAEWYNEKLAPSHGRTEVELYLDYIDRISDYAAKVDAIGEELEVFLLGVPMRGEEGKAMTNPRAVVNHFFREALEELVYDHSQEKDYTIDEYGGHL